MPQVLVPIISAIGSAVGGVVGASLIMYAGTYAAAVTLIGSLALSATQSKKAKEKARAQYEASVVDRIVNVQTPTASRELVLGRTRKGGAVFFRSSVAPHNAVYVSVLALAGHEIAAVERIYFNETPVDLDAEGNVTTAPWGRINRVSAVDTSAQEVRTLAHTPVPGTVFVSIATGLPRPLIPGQESLPYTLVGNTLTILNYDPAQFYTVTYQWEQFVSTARAFVHLGSPDQAADTRMQLLLPGVWTANHRARGVAYLECEFVYEETSFPTGLPNITAQIAGAKVYDPRTGLTQWSENPAILMRHVLTHPQFGKRTAITPAEDARIIAAANACDVLTDYGGPVVPLYRAAIVVPFGAAARDVLDDLQQAMGGEWAYAAGEFFVRAGVYQAPVMNLTESDLAVVQRTNDGSVSQNPITLSPHKPRNDRINIVAARIWDEAAKYVETPVSPYRAEALIAADGAELAQEVVMPAVFFAPQAFHICGIMLRDSRDPLTVTLPFKMKAYPLELFDSITLTIPRYGWTAKEFRILGRTFSPDGLVHLTLKETTWAIFAVGQPLVPGGYADDSGLPLPWDINPPSITSITSGESELIVQTDGTIVNSVRVVWAPIQERSIVNGGSVEIQYLILPGNGTWTSVVVPGDLTDARLLGPNDNDLVVIRARTFNSLAASDWTLHLYHRVIGKTEPPPDIENLTISGSVLSWSMPRRVPDLAGFVFRFHYGNNLDWNSAVPLHNGLITESPYDLVTRPGGVVTIMGKAQDTSGNQSLATANIAMNLGDPPIANVIEQWDFDAMGWPAAAGEQSGWTLVGGDPTADALDSFYGTDDQSFYGGDTESFYETGQYGQMVYVTPPISLASALAGSVMTLTADTDGTDLHIDYRLAGPGSFYGPDNDSFYRPEVPAYDPDLGIIVATSPPFYGPPGAWMPWPGQLIAENEAYQFRVTIGAGTTRGKLKGLIVTVDAPDIEEQINDLLVAAGGTVIPHTKPFSVIKNISATLQANGSGGVTLETTKVPNLSPVIRVFNAAHVSVGGATVDITLKGY